VGSPRLHLDGEVPHLSYAGILRRALMWAFVFLLLGIGGDYLAGRLGLEHDLLYVNDLVSAVAIAILVVVYESRRRKRIQERLDIIAQMNHHVRNALQLISLSPHAKQREENLALIQQAVDRIEWALREVLPGSEAGLIRDARNAPDGFKTSVRPTQ
jgi:hypothetical protein